MLEIDPLNANMYVGVWSDYMDLGNAKEALAVAEHYREIVTPTNTTADGLIAMTQWILLGDLAGGIEHGRRYRSSERTAARGHTLLASADVLRHRRSANGRLTDGTWTMGFAE